jgi:hypothetical protein
MSHETTAQSMCLRWLASKATFMAAKEPHEYQACHRRADSEPAGRIRADAESKGKGVLHRDVAPAFRRKPMWINVATSDDLDSTPLGLGPQNCPALRPHQELHPIKKGIRKAVAQKVHAGWVGRRLLQSAPWFYFLNPHSRRPYGRTGPSFEFGSANANFGIGLAGNPQFHISPQDTVITDAY